MVHADMAGTSGFELLKQSHVTSAMGKDFHHPYTPYAIQETFMQTVYEVLRDGKVGILESPTGTVGNLSLDRKCFTSSAVKRLSLPRSEWPAFEAIQTLSYKVNMAKMDLGQVTQSNLCVSHLAARPQRQGF